MKRRFPFFVGIPLVILLLAAVVMLLWNGVLTEVITVGKIHYLQALGLLVLCRILFGSFHFGGGLRRPFYGPPPHIRSRWMSMSDEERLRFKEEWKRRCGERR
jgi:hypothetical protein